MNFGFSIRTASMSRSPRNSHFRKPGFTLVELLVGFTLTTLLLGLMFQFLVPALRISNRTTLRAETQQQATLFLRKLVDEMERSTLFGTSFSQESPVLAIHPITEVTQNSNRVYEDHLVIYAFDKEKNSIRRNRWRNGDSPDVNSPRKLSPEELLQVDAFLVGPERVVVNQVEDFQITHSGVDNLVRLPLVVHLKMKESEQAGSRSFELIRAVSMRNQQ